jgi:hypothetical protein
MWPAKKGNFTLRNKFMIWGITLQTTILVRIRLIIHSTWDTLLNDGFIVKWQIIVQSHFSENST